MINSLVLIEGRDLDLETLSHMSLDSAKQTLVGSWRGSVILDVAANSPADLGNALLDIAQVPGVTGVFTLALRTPQ